MRRALYRSTRLAIGPGMALVACLTSCVSAQFSGEEEGTGGPGDVADARIDAPFADVPLDAPAAEGDAPPCTADSCNDGNPCTDETCTSSGCLPTHNAAPCDDGVFCNGADQCDGGSCSLHAGGPCPGQTTCDEEADTCQGCDGNDDCPAEIADPWSECTYSSTCTATGSQTRNVRTFSCVQGSCVANDDEQSQLCTRDNRDGTSCGETTCGNWTECDWTGFCDEAAQQNRACTDRVCSAGSCTPVLRSESSSCTRQRNGQECSAQSCTGWSSCGYTSDCDENAQRSRLCTTYACGGGNCNGSSSSQTEACSRDTENQRCGSNPTYCGTLTDCRVCRNETCTLNTPHYNAACAPSCGVSRDLCGLGDVMCCGISATCNSAGPGPWSDCAVCCDYAGCF